LALKDAEKALELDPESSWDKAHFRAARSLFSLFRYQEALDHLSQLRDKTLFSIEIENNARQMLEKEAKLALQRQKEIKVSERVCLVLKKRGIQRVEGCEDDVVAMFGPACDRSGLPRVSFAEKSASNLVWPVIFLYPSYGQSDFIRDFDERATFQDELATIFEQPAPWDTENIYRDPKQFKLFYNLPTLRTIHQIDKKLTLKEMTSKLVTKYDQGILALYVLPPSGRALDDFLTKFDAPL